MPQRRKQPFPTSTDPQESVARLSAWSSHTTGLHLDLPNNIESLEPKKELLAIHGCLLGRHPTWPKMTCFLDGFGRFSEPFRWGRNAWEVSLYYPNTCQDHPVCVSWTSLVSRVGKSSQGTQMGWSRWRSEALRATCSFPTCQVRVVRFYLSSTPPSPFAPSQRPNSTERKRHIITPPRPQMWSTYWRLLKNQPLHICIVKLNHYQML